MKTESAIAVIAAVMFFFVSSKCYCDNSLSYDDTVNLIKETMIHNTSVSRKESYSYITFDNCMLQYKVSGTYPVGDLYTITYSNIDLSSLNHSLSKTGHDYTAFVILRFHNDITFKDDFKELSVNTIVINMFDDEKAGTLFKAFLHAGELCAASKTSL